MLCLVTEYSEKGDLLKLVNLMKKKKAFFSEIEVWKIIIDISF